MASGLSRLLEEESEHQWLAIGLFALFALAGGWAVAATGTLSSLSHAPVTAAWQGHDVIDVAMIDGEWDLAHVGIVVNQQGPLLYVQQTEGQDGVTIITTTDVPERLLKTDDGAWWDAGNGVLRGYAKAGDQAMEYKQTLSGLESGQAIDLVQAEGSTEVLGWILVQDGQSTSAVAYDGLGSPFTAVDSPEGTTWTHLERVDDRHLAAVGWRVSNTPGQNPAQPEQQATVTLIQIDAGTMVNLETLRGPEGTSHTVAAVGEKVLIATEKAALLVGSDAKTTDIDVKSTAAMAAEDGSLWFAGGADSTLMPRWIDGTLETERLAAPLGVSVTASESDGHRWLLFGLDGTGDHAALVLDADHTGSLLSGRGFLNLLFLIVGTMCILGLAGTWWRQATA